MEEANEGLQRGRTSGVRRRGGRVWAWLFFGLALLNAAALLWMFVLAWWMAPEERLPGTGAASSAEGAKLEMNTTKQDLNKLMNHYLRERLKHERIRYVVRVAEYVELHGTIQAFGKNLVMRVDFEPQALENGDLLLKVAGIHVGKLPLPVARVLDYVRDSYALPEWIEVQPKREAVYAALTQIKLNDEMRLEAGEIDLQKDVLRFQFRVPIGGE